MNDILEFKLIDLELGLLEFDFDCSNLKVDINKDIDEKNGKQIINFYVSILSKNDVVAVIYACFCVLTKTKYDDILSHEIVYSKIEQLFDFCEELLFKDFKPISESFKDQIYCYKNKRHFTFKFFMDDCLSYTDFIKLNEKSEVEGINFLTTSNVVKYNEYINLNDDVCSSILIQLESNLLVDDNVLLIAERRSTPLVNIIDIIINQFKKVIGEISS